MAHSHERTLLSKLGFADPDKKEPRHDAACRYVSQQGIADKLLRGMLRHTRTRMIRFKAEPEYHLTKGQGAYKTTIGFLDTLLNFTIEGWTNESYPIAPLEAFENSESADKYQGICEYLAGDPKKEPIKFNYSNYAIVEVKTTPVAVGDILRQMNLYLEYFKSTRGSMRYYLNGWGKIIDSPWYRFSRTEKLPITLPDSYEPPPMRVLVIDFPLTQDELQALHNENIKVMRLGNDFSAYLERSISNLASIAEI